MTNFLFIRHATHDLLQERILGRTPGIHLNESGKRQAERLADRISVFDIDAVYSSPLERARESASPLAHRLNLPLVVADEFNELNMGDWTNRTFCELNALEEWQRWNTFRSKTTPPEGESMLEVQQRVLRKLADLGYSVSMRCDIYTWRRHPGRVHILFGHASGSSISIPD